MKIIVTVDYKLHSERPFFESRALRLEARCPELDIAASLELPHRETDFNELEIYRNQVRENLLEKIKVFLEDVEERLLGAQILASERIEMEI